MRNMPVLTLIRRVMIGVRVKVMIGVRVRFMIGVRVRVMDPDDPKDD